MNLKVFHIPISVTHCFKHCGTDDEVPGYVKFDGGCPYAYDISNGMYYSAIVVQ